MHKAHRPFANVDLTSFLPYPVLSCRKQTLRPKTQPILEAVHPPVIPTPPPRVAPPTLWPAPSPWLSSCPNPGLSTPWRPLRLWVDSLTFWVGWVVTTLLCRRRACTAPRITSLVFAVQAEPLRMNLKSRMNATNLLLTNQSNIATEWVKAAKSLFSFQSFSIFKQSSSF